MWVFGGDEDVEVAVGFISLAVGECAGAQAEVQVEFVEKAEAETGHERELSGESRWRVLLVLCAGCEILLCLVVRIKRRDLVGPLAPHRFAFHLLLEIFRQVMEWFVGAC